MKKLTQGQIILDVLQRLQVGASKVPKLYLKKDSDGDYVSARYFKHVMYISECNGRLSELRRSGFLTESPEERDPYGFSYHRLQS